MTKILFLFCSLPSYSLESLFFDFILVFYRIPTLHIVIRLFVVSSLFYMSFISLLIPMFRVVSLLPLLFSTLPLRSLPGFRPVLQFSLLFV